MLRCCGDGYEFSDGEVEDDDAEHLSYVGMAAYEVLRKKHNRQHHALWNVTSGSVQGEIHQTPKNSFLQTRDPDPGHDDWFPEAMGEIMARTTIWCDVMSLGPPDGLFMEKFQEALLKICDTAAVQDKKITIRMMFGNIVGMPVNCNKVIKKLTQKLPPNPNIRLWVGAWRKGVSWNHAKLIAVDGLFLHTGGHNMWDYHYLKHNPVHDLSLEIKGRVAHDGHLFANDQWRFIEKIQTTPCGTLIDKLPDNMILLAKTRVTVSEYPQGQTTEFPPYYKKRFVPMREIASDEVPMISMGRYGSVLRYYRPSDDAIIAMFDSAKKIIRLALQDLGPVRIPNTQITVPGCIWPSETLEALGRAIWKRGLDVEIVLSNPVSIPGGLSPTEAQYGNGWSCVDVAAEIVKRIKRQFPTASNDKLSEKVSKNLRVCFIRRKPGNKWDNGKDTVGMHAKHFIIDDICTYIGSQNLYICDLAEWGVVIDHKETVSKIMHEYWIPMWQVSYVKGDLDVKGVMAGLETNRDGEKPSMFATGEQRRQTVKASVMQMGMLSKRGSDLYDDEGDEDEPIDESDKTKDEKKDEAKHEKKDEKKHDEKKDEKKHDEKKGKRKNLRNNKD